MLQAYKQRNPDVVILDPPEAIQKVYNRKSMLQEVDSLNFCHPQGFKSSCLLSLSLLLTPSNDQSISWLYVLGNVRAPKQLVVYCEPIIIHEKVSKAGLKFPLG